MAVPLYEALKSRIRRQAPYRWWCRRRAEAAMVSWLRASVSGPPPALFKQYLVRAYGSRFGAETLVETGTYLGEMVEASASHFRNVYTIELDPSLHRRAVSRLGHLPNVTFLLGDSGSILSDVLRQVSGPAVFWLDGHYSGGVTARGEDDTPVLRELAQIFAANRSGDVLLIDDARCFDGRNDYPTIEALVHLLEQTLGGVVNVADDVVRATPGWL